MYFILLLPTFNEKIMFNKCYQGQLVISILGAAVSALKLEKKCIELNRFIHNS